MAVGEMLIEMTGEDSTFQVSGTLRGVKNGAAGSEENFTFQSNPFVDLNKEYLWGNIAFLSLNNLVQCGARKSAAIGVAPDENQQFRLTQVKITKQSSRD
jgi:hypothetical protein